MTEQQTPQQEAGKAIIAWAKQSYEPISTADDEMAAMEKMGLVSGMRVDLISIEPLDDMWKARLAMAGGRFDIIVTFWLDDIHQLQENRLHIEDVQQEEPGTDVPPMNMEPIHLTDAEKQRAYSDFHDQVSRLMSDERIGPTAKVVMVAYFVHSTRMEGMAGDLQIAHMCNLPMHELKEAQQELMMNDWLASPQG